MTESSLTRREAIRGAGAALTVSTTAAAISAPVAARETADFTDAKPESVTVAFDGPWLEQYRPYLDLSSVPLANRPTLYGWRAVSRDPDVETDVAVFATEYAVQDDYISLTSHAGDHEWIYVFVDSATGEVTEVAYCAYHWLRGYVQNPAVWTEDGGSHPGFKVAKTYHNFVPLPDSTESSVLLDVQSLGDYATASGPLYQWLGNGMSEDIEPGAVHNPWQLKSDGTLNAWWRTDSKGFNRYLLDAWVLVSYGFGIPFAGSAQSEFGDAEEPL